jgi:outer membrane protein OmpA-like peptidoglycan-associated protein
MENGVVRTDVVLTETSTGSGWEVVGPNFSMVAKTEARDRSPMQLLPDGSMQVPQGGFLEFGGTGFAPNSEVAMFAIPVTGSRSIARLIARSISNAVYLGSAVTSSSGTVSAQFTIPTNMALGDYVWQVNGVSPTNQLRSVNFGLVVVPTMRAGSVRQAAFYQGKSAKLSRLGRAKLRGLVAQVPNDARDVRVNIVGVSVSLSNTPRNLNLARDRAETISTFLTRRGVAGEYTVSVTTTFTVREAERSSRAVAGDTSPTSLDQPLKSKRGKPLTTATISFKAPASSAR